MSGNAVGTTVLIATRNRPQFLRECLESLRRCDCSDTEILVLDQSDGRESESVVSGFSDRGMPLRHFPLRSRGKSRALNAGIRRARGSRIVLTDDDCTVAEDWLAAIDRAFSDAGDDPGVVITGQVLAGRHAPDGTPPPSCIENPEPAEYAGKLGREVVYQNWAVRREIFDRVGLFDERLGPGGVLRNAEDNDMAYRWLASGCRVLYRPEIVVRHNGWRSRTELIALKWDYGVGQGAFYAKHACRGDGHMAGRFLRDAFRQSRFAAGDLLKGELFSFRANLTFLAGLLAGASSMAFRTMRREPEWSAEEGDRRC